MNWIRKHKILSAAGVVSMFFLVLAISTTGEGSDGTGSQSASPSSDEEPAEIASIGQPVRDGKFEFVVHGIECGETSIGDSYFASEAQGVFCMINLTVSNIGNEPQYLFADNQYLYDEDGRKFNADSEAMFNMGGSSDAWLEEINPGNSVDGVIPFDVPEGVSPVSIELHDSMFSNGVTVEVG